MPKDRKHSNRDRILDASLELFNTRGYASVTTNLIVEHLSISPGNLYYHFRNKEEIIDAIYLEMFEYVRRTAAMPSGGELTPSGFAHYYTNSMETLWRYRCIFGDTQEILRRSSMASEHRKFMQWTTGRLADLFGLLSSEGRLGAVPDETLRMVAANSALLLTNWWRYLNTAYPPSDITIESVRLGAVHAFSLIEPYLVPGFAEGVRSAIANTSNA